MFGKGGTKTILSSVQNVGEKFIMTKQEQSKANLENHTLPCTWLGYADSHAIGTYHMQNPKTRQVILTQDAVFMKKSYFDEVKDKR